MATVGGRRPGAGRPPGGISQARRLIEQALRRGMADAMRARGAQGDDEVLAVEAAAQVVTSMMLAGQGDRVLALWASVATKEAPGAPADAPGAGLAQWLARVPGADGGPVSARLPATLDPDVEPAGDSGGGPTDSGADVPPAEGAPASGGGPDLPGLPGQAVLGIDAPPCATTRPVAPARALALPGAQAGAPAPTPTPARALARATIPVRTPIFEISARADGLCGDVPPRGPGAAAARSPGGDSGVHGGVRWTMT